MHKRGKEADPEGKEKKREPAEDLIRAGGDVSPHVAEEPRELSDGETFESFPVYLLRFVLRGAH
jgi:hypothetical protein